jgi:flagellin
MSQVVEKLASGLRINHAKDDPFRNHETSDMNSKIRNTNKAIINSKDGASLLQIAEGTCNEVQSILQRVRELSVQCANDTLSSAERKYLNDEVTELLKEVDRIAMSATFNAKQIFGNKGDAFSNEERTLRRPTSDEDKDFKYWQPLATKNAHDIYFKNMEENDLRYWKPFSSKDANGNELRAGVLHIGPGATRPDEVKVSIPELSASSLGLKDLIVPYDSLNVPTLTYHGVNISSQNGATKAINDVDIAISSVSTIRTYMGILVNRMERQVEDLESKNIEMSDYVNKVKDTDFAKETTTFTASQIQLQAAVSMLTQSNSRVGRVLEILGG